MADEPPSNRKGFQSLVFFDIYDEMEARIAEEARMKILKTDNDEATPDSTAASNSVQSTNYFEADRKGHWIMTRSRTKRAAQERNTATKTKNKARKKNSDVSEEHRAQFPKNTSNKGTSGLGASSSKPNREELLSESGQRMKQSQINRTAADSN